MLKKVMLSLMILASMTLYGETDGYDLYLEEVLKEETHNYIPPDGVVPDEETAVSMAIVILSPVYGKEKILKQKPFKATLRGNYWIVIGSMPEGKMMLGGTAIIVINKTNGEIINISHGK